MSRWSCPDLACEAIARGLVATISASTVRWILAEDTLKPWQHQSWILIRAPAFAAEAARVLDSYARRCDNLTSLDQVEGRLIAFERRYKRPPGPSEPSITG